eukprot:scaffold219875_cov42-Prasinocladus_malaysianus.AAC.1
MSPHPELAIVAAWAEDMQASSAKESQICWTDSSMPSIEKAVKPGMHSLATLPQAASPAGCPT